jgi:hypothetical protein
LNSLGLAQRSLLKLIEPFIWNYIVGNNLEDSELRSMIALPCPNNQLSTPPLAATIATISPNPTVHEMCRSEECTPTKIDLISGNDFCGEVSQSIFDIWWQKRVQSN